MSFRWHNFFKGLFECFAALIIVNTKIASGLLKPLVLIFLIWLCRFLWLFGFCHTASQ
jgi:hypothetical protein